MESVSFNIPSLSCSACSGKIQEGIRSLNGVKNVSVDLKTQSVNIDFDPAGIRKEDIRKEISSMGYEIVQ